MLRGLAALLANTAAHLLTFAMLLLLTFSSLAFVADKYASAELADADRHSHKEIENQLANLESFFAAAKDRTPAFANDALYSWSFSNILDLQTHVRTSFDQNLFTEEQLN